MSSLEDLRQKKDKLKLQVKQLKEQGADASVIEPVFKKYTEVAQALKDMEAGAPSSPAVATPAAKPSRAELDAEKDMLKAKIKKAKDAGMDGAEIQKMYDRYLEIKAVLDADPGTPFTPSAPAPAPAPAKAGGGESIDDLNKRKNELKARVKFLRDQPSPNEDEIRRVYDEYTRVKEQIDGISAVAPLGADVTPVFTPAPKPKDDEGAANRDEQLWLAAKKGSLEEVNRLLREGAKVEVRKKFGATPLCIAAHQGHVDVVRRLLDGGAQVDAPAEEGVTPLWVATQNKHVPVVELLLERGANKEAKKDGIVTPLWIASYIGNLQCVRLLVTAGANLEAKKDNITALSIAVEKGQVQCAKFLIQAGAALEAADNEGFTPLHVACERETAVIVRALLDRGANMEAQTREGLTAIEVAAQCGYGETVKMLQQAGAIIRCPLHVV